MPPNSKSRVKRPDRNRSAMADAIEIRTHSGLSLTSPVRGRVDESVTGAMVMSAPPGNSTSRTGGRAPRPAPGT